MGKRLTYVLSDCMLLIMWAESGCTKQSLDHRKREGHVHIALQWDKGYTPAGSRFSLRLLAGGITHRVASVR